MAKSINTNNVTCEECAKQFRVHSSNDIEPGDHVVFNRLGYEHHAIVVKRLTENTFRIIGATNTASGLSSGKSVVPKRKASIMSSEKKLDFEKTRICVVRYKRRYPKDETVKRAIEMSIDLQVKLNYDYHLFNNNCEHFASYCATGVGTSIQVHRFAVATRDVFSKRGLREFDDITKKLKDGLICQTCFDDVRNIFEVKCTPIKKKDSIEIGDIIRYEYWRLPHQAVVLEIERRTESQVKCIIVHYAFRGIFRRRIQTDRLVIKLNGKFGKLEYNSPKFDVYESDEVVRRARTRLDEQEFNPWTNNSSTFTRWCKLKNWRTRRPDT